MEIQCELKQNAEINAYINLEFINADTENYYNTHNGNAVSIKWIPGIDVIYFIL